MKESPKEQSTPNRPMDLPPEREEQVAPGEDQAGTPPGRQVSDQDSEPAPLRAVVINECRKSGHEYPHYNHLAEFLCLLCGELHEHLFCARLVLLAGETEIAAICYDCVLAGPQGVLPRVRRYLAELRATVEDLERVEAEIPHATHWATAEELYDAVCDSTYDSEWLRERARDLATSRG